MNAFRPSAGAPPPHPKSSRRVFFASCALAAGAALTRALGPVCVPMPERRHVIAVNPYWNRDAVSVWLNDGTSFDVPGYETRGMVINPMTPAQLEAWNKHVEDHRRHAARHLGH